MIVVVCSIIAEQNGKFLMVREKKPEAIGKYGLPGGQLEIGETLIQCAQREFTEETGYIAENITLVGISHKPETHAGNSVVRFVYRTNKIHASEIRPELDISLLSKNEIAALSRSDKIRGADILDLLELGSTKLTVSTY